MHHDLAVPCPILQIVRGAGNFPQAGLKKVVVGGGGARAGTQALSKFKLDTPEFVNGPVLCIII